MDLEGNATSISAKKRISLDQQQSCGRILFGRVLLGLSLVWFESLFTFGDLLALFLFHLFFSR
jgi:hypothetical protein